MNLTYTRPGELRKPDVEVLPDGRIRITRFIAAGHGDRDLGEVTTSVGTTDNGLNTALLVKKGMTRWEGKDAIVLTYEVRNASTETPVGKEDVQFGENGLKTVIADWVQMSSGAYTPQTVGTTTSTYDPTCVLRQEIMEDDGTTRQIRRVYVNKGLINQIDEIRNNGALLLKTLVYLNDSPSPNPPTGYTLINTRVENPLGLETTSYTFAKGNGQIETNSETRLQGMLLRTTVTYLTDPSVTTNPTSDPFGTGGTITGTDVREADGYKVWTVTYVKAVSTDNIVESTETRNGGKLVIYRRSKLGAAPTAPSATIGGTVTLISDQTEKQDGYTAYTRTWAEGVGQISQDDETRNQGALLLRTIRYLSAGSVTSNPISTPATYTLVSSTYAEQDGYKIWTASFAKGSGTVATSTEYRNQGKLVIYKETKLGSAPSAPSPTIGGTVVLIDASTRQQDGYALYDYTWAEGTGVISRSYDIRIAATLVVHSATSLAAAPSTPSAVISGTIVNTVQRTREESGVTIYDYEWVESVSSTVSLDVRSREDGSIVYGISIVSPTQSTPAYPGTGTGYLVDDAYERGNGYYTNKATYIKLPADYNYPKQVSFTVPGLVTAANPPIIQPPVNRNLMATAYVSFSGTQTTDVPYTVATYAQFSLAYTRDDDGKAYAEQRGYDGYVGSSTYNATNTTLNGVLCSTISMAVSGANPTSPPSGLTILAVDCEKYLTTTTGTTIWRNVTVKYTF